MQSIFIKISRSLTVIMNIAIFIVGIALCAALIDSLITLCITAWDKFFVHDDYNKIVEELITFFLYFEFLALITKYFKNNFHFPLHYFLYIGITAIVRLIIVSHDLSTDILIWSISILVLVISLLLVEKFVQRD